MAESPAALARRTIAGVGWAYGAYVGARVLTLAATVVLARALSPAEFGIVALALALMVFLDTIRDLGLGQALIVAPDDGLEERAQTVFGWSLVIGVGLSLLTAGLAPVAGAAFGEPQLTPLLAALGLTFLLRGIAVTPLALARRALDFRARTIAELADAATRGGLSIALALAGVGAWSLVAGYLAGAAVQAAVIWAQVSFRPRWALTRAHLGRLLRFGGTLTAVDVGAAFAHELDYLFVGMILGAESLGVYVIAFRLPELLVVNLAVVASTVLFPAFARVDPARLRAAFLIALRATAMLVLPLAVMLAVLAEAIVGTLFGPAWDEAVPVMRVLAAYAVVVALNVPAGTVFKVTDRAWVLVAFTVPYVVLLAGALATATPRGLVAVAIVMAGLQAIFAIAGWLVTMRLLDVRARALAGALWAPFAAALTMGGVLAALALALGPGSALTLVAGALAAPVVYGAALLCLAPDVAARAAPIRAAVRAAGAGAVASLRRKRSAPSPR